MQTAMYYQMTPEEYDEAMHRMQQCLEVRTQTELAGKLHVKQSTISDAKRRGHIPEKWLLRLVMEYHLNPAWILYGTGSKHLAPHDLPPAERDVEAIVMEAPIHIVMRALAVWLKNQT